MNKIKGLLVLKGTKRYTLFTLSPTFRRKTIPKQYTQIRVEINVYKTHVPSNYILFPGGCEGDSELILLNKSH